jgi:hypothetical protein
MSKVMCLRTPNVKTEMCLGHGTAVDACEPCIYLTRIGTFEESPNWREMYEALEKQHGHLQERVADWLHRSFGDEGLSDYPRPGAYWVKGHWRGGEASTPISSQNGTQPASISIASSTSPETITESPFTVYPGADSGPTR